MLLVLNTEGDDAEMAKTSSFHDKIDLESCPERTFIDGAFIGSRPDGFEQFQMQFIPHLCVLDKDAVLLGHQVKADEAIDMARRLATSTEVQG